LILSLTTLLILASLATAPFQEAVSSSPSAEPGRLRLTESAIEALLTRMLFDEEGRWHLKEPSDCGYAIVQNHSVELAAGLIGIRAKLFWSEAKHLFGECRGPSTNFEVLATAVPAAGGATLGLRDIQVSAPDGGVVAAAALALLKSKIPSSHEVDVALLLSEALTSAEMTDLLVVDEFQATHAEVGDGTLDLGLALTLTSRY